MNITKEKLTKIIAEEIEKTLNEKHPLIDTLFYDVKDALEDEESLDDIFDAARRNRANPVMTHHYDLDGFSDEEIWKAIKTIEKMPEEEKTTDETLDSVHFPPVNKPTKKCPEGETMSSKSGKCEPNRVKPNLRQEQ